MKGEIILVFFIFILAFLLLAILTETYFWIRRLLFRKTFNILINPSEVMPLEKFLKEIFCLANIHREVLKPIYLILFIIGTFLFGSVVTDFVNLLFSKGAPEKIFEVANDLLFHFSYPKLLKSEQLRYDSLIRLLLSFAFSFPLLYLFIKMVSKRSSKKDIGFSTIINDRELTEKHLDLMIEKTDILIKKYHSEKMEIIKLMKISFKILILPFTAVLFKEMTSDIAISSILLIISVIIGFAISLYQDFDSFNTLKYIGTKNYFKYGYAKQILLEMKSLIDTKNESET